MSSQISFAAALGHFGNATQGLAYAVWNAVPSGSEKVRIITLGFTCAVAAAVCVLTYKAIFAAFALATQGGAALFAAIFGGKQVIPHRPNDNQNNRQPHRPPSRANIPSPPRSPSSSLSETNSQSVAIKPLPIDAAKERNQALTQFLDLIDEYVINPMVIENKKLLDQAKALDNPFIQDMARNTDDLKEWLRAIALWQLGLAWDKLEAGYVKSKTPPPPTLESIQGELNDLSIDEDLKKSLLEIVQPKETKTSSEEEEPNLLDTASVLSPSSDIRVGSFQNAVTESNLTDQEKLSLIALSLKLKVVIDTRPISQEQKDKEANEIRKEFALIMHSGVATTLSTMPTILKGWMRVFEKTQKKQEPSKSNANNKVENDRELTEKEQKLQIIIGKITNTLTGELSEKYFEPLWDKTTKKWESDQPSGEEIKGEDQLENSSTLFLDKKADEKTFLESEESQQLSTSEIATLSFLRAIRCMQNKQDSLKDSMKTLPKSLMLQMEPMLLSTLVSATDMLETISFERTVPKVTNFAIDILECCRAMQEVRSDESQLFSSFINMDQKNQALESTLKLAGVSEETSQQIIDQLSNTPQQRILGKDIIKQLGSKAHKNYRVGVNAPEIQEQTWIKTKKERLKGLLLLQAKEYAGEPAGQWLSSLLKGSTNGGQTTLIGSLLSLQDKLWSQLPGIEPIFKFLLEGIQGLIEDKACTSIQEALDKCTETGYISTAISTLTVTGLLDLYKKIEDWNSHKEMIQTAYSFLQPDEQKVVLKHLGFQFTNQQIHDKRKKSLGGAQADETIQAIKAKENALGKSLKAIEEARRNLRDDQKDEIEQLETAYGELKREKELQQFDRTRTLVVYVVDQLLQEKLTFRGGDKLKTIILTVLQEAFTLLSYQEVVKHWIFKITDLILKELEAATGEQEKSVSEDNSKADSQKLSILDFVQKEQQGILLQQLTELMNTSSKQEGWFNAAAWIQSAATFAANWAPDQIWGLIKSGFEEDLKITPKELTDLIVEGLEKFGTDPAKLSDLVIEALTGHVADPRPEITVVEKDDPKGKGKEKELQTV